MLAGFVDRARTVIVTLFMAVIPQDVMVAVYVVVTTGLTTVL